MNYDELNAEFYNAYHRTTSGSAGAAMLKLLHERLEEYNEAPPFKALENACDVLLQLNTVDPHPWLLGQITGAWDALLKHVKQDKQMKIDAEREQQWYITECPRCGNVHDTREECPD